jgi:hypothetical protein
MTDCLTQPFYTKFWYSQTLQIKKLINRKDPLKFTKLINNKHPKNHLTAAFIKQYWYIRIGFLLKASTYFSNMKIFKVDEREVKICSQHNHLFSLALLISIG